MRASVNVLSVLHSDFDTPALAKRNRIDLVRVTLKLTHMSAPVEFKNVTAIAKANIYFDGKVVSHTILFPDGSKKTLGLIYPGKFYFGTDKAERMEIVAGGCQVKLDGQTATKDHTAGSAFDVPSKSGFDIEVKGSLCEYVCSFID
jgi:purine/pyrimidine-nucleoside phosphorylase